MKPAAPVLTLGTFTTGSGAPLSSPEVQRQMAATLLAIPRPVSQPAPSAKPA
jgi:hypothetical protein